MLRISQVSTDAQPTLRLEGEVKGPWVDELRRECARAVTGNGRTRQRLVLDLAEVSFVDAAGVALFRELKTRQVRMTNCSLYLAELLKR
jgi:anti-anti-sigma factor